MSSFEICYLWIQSILFVPSVDECVLVLEVAQIVYPKIIATISQLEMRSGCEYDGKYCD